MGEHGTWFDYLNRFAWWNDLHHCAKGALGREWKWQMFGETGFTLNHVLATSIVFLFVTWGASAFLRGLKTKDKGILPPRSMNLRNFFEYMAESVYGMVEGAMGEKHAPRFFPLIGALWCFILFSNLFALIPGFSAPTDTIKTNIGIALFVFLLTHYYGLREHGLSYLALSVRLRCSAADAADRVIPHRPPAVADDGPHGNMMADHKVSFVLRAHPFSCPAVPAALPADLSDPDSCSAPGDGLHRHAIEHEEPEQPSFSRRAT